MVLYLANIEDKSDPIWTQLLSAFELGMSDIVFEMQAVHLINELNIKYGYDKLKKSLNSHIKEPNLEFLYWFAKASIKDVIADLEKYLASKDIDELVFACVSLALVDDKRGIETIEKLCEGTHNIKLEQSPKCYFEGYIDEIKSPKIEAIKSKYFYD